jgi:hypothetical protein
MNGEILMLIGALIALSWGRHIIQLAVQEFRIRRLHYRS